MLKGGRYVNDRLNDYIIYKQGGRGGGGGGGLIRYVIQNVLLSPQLYYSTNVLN